MTRSRNSDMQYEENQLEIEETAFKKRLGKKIKTYRDKAGLSQLKLALNANISRTQVSRLENAQISTSVTTLLRIARALHLTKQQISDLLD